CTILFTYLFLYVSTFFSSLLIFFFNSTAPTEIYTLSLHDALPISGDGVAGVWGDSRRPPGDGGGRGRGVGNDPAVGVPRRPLEADRKSTRLNSSHVAISYAVFCLKKKKNKQTSSDCISSKKNNQCR